MKLVRQLGKMGVWINTGQWKSREEDRGKIMDQKMKGEGYKNFLKRFQLFRL